jgi:hypothetical protein
MATNPALAKAYRVLTIDGRISGASGGLIRPTLVILKTCWPLKVSSSTRPGESYPAAG